MSNLPEGWVNTTLGDFAEIQSGSGFPIKYQGSKEGAYPFAKVSDISRAVLTRDGILDTASNFVSEATRLDLRAKIIPKGATVFAKIGAALLLNRRAICATDVLLDNNATGVWPLSKDIDRNWLFGFLRQFDITSLAAGNAIPSVRKSDLCLVDVALPPAAEQKRIVAKLESCESRINTAREALDEVPALLEQYRQSILAAAFRGDLTKDWRTANSNTEPASELLSRLRIERRQRWEENTRETYKSKGKKPPPNWKNKYTEPTEPEPEALKNFPSLPQGWSYQTLEAICDASRSICYGVIKLGTEEKEGVPCLRTSDVRHLRIDTSGVKKISPKIAANYFRTKLKGGEVLVNVRGTLGGVASVPPNMKDWNISREVAMAPVLSQISSQFCTLTIASLYAQKWLTAVVKGVAYSGINIADLKALPIPIPPKHEQEQIVQAFEKASEKMSLAVQSTFDALALTKQFEAALLAKAFSGQLVPQDPTDEPASVLLARIQADRESQEPTKKAAKRPRKKSPKSS